MVLRGTLSVNLPVLVGLAVCLSGSATAQETTTTTLVQGDPQRGKTVYQRIGYCVNCHGWAGDGQSGRNPLSHAAAANLRETALDAEGLAQVIKCGLPGTAMPYHDAAAYKDDRCYGMVLSDFEPDEAPPRGKTFRDKQLSDLIAYLQTSMIGLGKPTYDECAAYFESSADKACSYLKAN